MAVVTPTAKTQFIDAAGAPLAGGKLYTYAAGTTTPQASYTDSTGATANSNPVILDSRGEANVWLGEATYKFTLSDSNDVEIWTVDNISAPTTALSPILSGNVVVSSDTVGAAFSITQEGGGYIFRAQDSTGDTNPVVITSARYVGIGTLAPAEALDIDNSGKIQFSASGTARTIISADATNSTIDVKDDRNFVVKTNGGTILTANDADITTTVPVVLPGSPTTNLQAATKAYADTKASGSATITAGTSITTSGTLSSGVTVSVTSGGITATQLASDSVTTNKILVSNVTTSRLADAAVTAAKLSGAQSGSAPVYGARAWASITSGAGISASGNVSSVSKGGTGLYQVNFTTNMPSSSYAAVATPTGTKNVFCDILSRSSSSCTVEVFSDSGSNVDNSFCLIVME